MPRVSEKVNCDIEDINELYAIVNNPSSQKQLVVRARIILLSNEGYQNKDIATELETNPNLVGNWIRRYREGGIEALYDLHRSGRAGKDSSIDVYAAIQERLESGSCTTGSQWTAAALADDIGVSKDRIWNALRAHNVDLDRKRSWDIETGNGIESRQVDVAGMFLSPSERAIILSFAPSGQLLDGKGVFSTRNRALAEDIGKASPEENAVLLKETLDAAAGHASDDKRFAHATLISYMNRLIDAVDDIKGLSYTVIFTGNAYVPTKSLHKSNILFHRVADSEEWLRTTDFIMGRFCTPSEYLPFMESLRRFIGSMEETTEDFIWMNRISLIPGDGASDMPHVADTAEPPACGDGAADVAGSGGDSAGNGNGLILTATYISESGERTATSVRIDGRDLPKRGQEAGKDGLIRYVNELTACVRPAIDKLGEESCNMLLNGIKKNGQAGNDRNRDHDRQAYREGGKPGGLPDKAKGKA